MLFFNDSRSQEIDSVWTPGTNHHFTPLLVKNLGWNGCGTTQYHYLFQLRFRADRSSMCHKSRCHREHQKCTFLFDWVWWSALPLNCATWINLPLENVREGRVVLPYLSRCHSVQTSKGDSVLESAEGCVTGGVGGDGWHACLQGLSMLLTTCFISGRLPWKVQWRDHVCSAQSVLCERVGEVLA